MKMVRGKIVKYFKKELDFLYTPKAKNIINEMNLEAIWNWNK
jgi:hypothetical protein